MPSIKFTAKKDRETKGTFRFAETGDPESQVVRTIYIRKSAAAKLGNPKSIEVTIEGK